MKTKLRTPLAATLGVVAFLSVAFVIAALNPPDYEIQFMASRQSWAKNEWAGHAFMMITTRTSGGIKEDAYGFYPKDAKTLIIGGPGVIASELKKNPSRFSRVTISIRQPISAAQRASVLRLVAEWNSQNYALTNQSC